MLVSLDAAANSNSQMGHLLCPSTLSKSQIQTLIKDYVIVQMVD